MKILKTKNYIFGVVLNEDGSLAITYEYRKCDKGQWGSCGSLPHENAGSLIGCYGGVNGVLDRCKEIERETLEEEVKQINEHNLATLERQKVVESQREEGRRERIENEYAEVFGIGNSVESTLPNIKVLLRKLNMQNWGSWELPAMSVGYSCHQYDCDGKIATTIKLDQPVEGYTKLQYGAPRGHLTGYTNIDMAIIESEEADKK